MVDNFEGGLKKIVPVLVISFLLFIPIGLSIDINSSKSLQYYSNGSLVFQVDGEGNITAYSNLNLRNNSFLNFFNNSTSCSSGFAVSHINEDGSYTCTPVVNNIEDNWVNITGDVMEGNLNMSGYEVQNLGNVTLDGDMGFTGGNVGIGTTSPDNLLHLAQQADSDGLKIGGYDDQSSENAILRMDSLGRFKIEPTSGLYLDAVGNLRLRGYTNVILSTNGEMKFNDAAGNRLMHLDASSGNVGIGTTSPGNKLDVSAPDTYGSWDSSADISSVDSCDGDNSTAYTCPYGTSGSCVDVKENTTGYFNRTVTCEVSNTSISGNVGIGTTSPGQKLTVIGDGNFTGNVYASNFSSQSPLRLQTGGVTRLTIDDSIGNFDFEGNLNLNGNNISSIGTLNSGGSVITAGSNLDISGNNITMDNGAIKNVDWANSDNPNTDAQDLSVGADPTGGSTTIDISNGASATFIDNYEADTTINDEPVNCHTVCGPSGTSGVFDDDVSCAADEFVRSVWAWGQNHGCDPGDPAVECCDVD